MISAILSRLVILVFGTLYPAYSSYKAVRTKNVKEYVKWMMYWIVFALFTCAETFTDVFLSWFPFYYEIKIILVVWLLSPATKGSSILYRKFVHPTLSSREQEIDEYINKAKEQSYRQVLDIGSKGVSAIMQTAIKGGGGLVNQLRKSYSLSDLSDPTQDETHDEPDTITDLQITRRRRSPHRSSSTAAVYFSEVDVRSDRIGPIQSAEDISSSGYSSGEGLSLKISGREGIHRTGSLTRSRSTRVTRSTVPKKIGASDESDENEEYDTNVIFQKDFPKKADSSSENEFYDTIDILHENFDDGLNNLNKNSKNTQILTACEGTTDNCKLINVPSDNATISTQEKILNVENNPDIIQITKNVTSFSSFMQNLIESKNDLDNRRADFTTDTFNNTTAEIEEPRKLRGGKYNKKHAPPPPQQHSSTPSIKATLVLKPGRVKTVGSTESLCKEIFLNAPKPKRQASRSSLSSNSSNSTRRKSSFSKLLSLPKKIGFWNKDDANINEKRSSWHNYLRPLSDSKMQSISDNNLLSKRTDIDRTVHASTGKNGSQLSLKSLTESPLAARRIKIIRRYVDEDID